MNDDQKRESDVSMRIMIEEKLKEGGKYNKKLAEKTNLDLTGRFWEFLKYEGKEDDSSDEEWQEEDVYPKKKNWRKWSSEESGSDLEERCKGNAIPKANVKISGRKINSI
jgi:broad specificity phosphatase PhoE